MKHFLVGAALGFVALAVTPANAAGPSIPKSPAQEASVRSNLSDVERLEVTDIDRQTIQFVVKLHVASLSQQRADLFSKTFTKKTQDAFDSPKELMIFFSLRYIPVVFAKSFQFDGMNLKGEVPIQYGYLIDKSGTRWRLSFGLQQIGNADWRIISTNIEHAPGSPT